MSEQWFCKEFVCTVCDAFYTLISKSDADRDFNCLECNGMMILISSRLASK